MFVCKLLKAFYPQEDIYTPARLPFLSFFLTVLYSNVLQLRLHLQVEQFCIASPEGNASWDAMEEMLGNAEAFYTVR